MWNTKNSLNILAAGIAHDVNNILGVLVTYPSLALAKLPSDSPVYRYIEKNVSFRRRLVSAI